MSFVAFQIFFLALGIENSLWKLNQNKIENYQFISKLNSLIILKNTFVWNAQGLFYTFQSNFSVLRNNFTYSIKILKSETQK